MLVIRQCAICTRQQPVGREERINFTLERRRNCHLRIWRGISLFPLLSSRWSVKRRRVFYRLRRLWAVCSRQSGALSLCQKALEVKLNQKSVILPTQCPRTDLLLWLVHTLPAALYPAARWQSIHIRIDAAWSTPSINCYFQSEFKLISGFQCGHKVLKQNI